MTLRRIALTATLRRIALTATLRRIALTATLLSVLGAAPRVVADVVSSDVWLISTRWAPRCTHTDSGSQQIRYWRLNDNRQWSKSDADAYLQGSDPAVPTTIFIHGNREDRNSAIRSAGHLHRRLTRDAAGRPFRFVIWSWPSDRIRGRGRQDVRLKAHYSDVQAFYLAECLARMDPKVNVNLVGYSFGVRTITGALHLLGGGMLLGDVLADRPDPAPTPKRRAVLVASALDCGSLLPGRRHEMALSQVEHVLITKNGCDRTLKWYPWMYGRRGPQALGYVGPARWGATENMEVVNVSHSIGRAHEWVCYLQAPGLRHRLAWYSFLEAPSPTLP